MATFYVFINNDLNMNNGQIVAQVSHITHVIVNELVSRAYSEPVLSKEVENYLLWNKIPKTVVLKANQKQLEELKSRDYARHFIDSGFRIPDNSLTVVGLLPGVYENISAGYKLL